MGKLAGGIRTNPAGASGVFTYEDAVPLFVFIQHLDDLVHSTIFNRASGAELMTVGLVPSCLSACVSSASFLLR